ncbi:MAG: methionyl-tRNA formyltransferase [Candidatus Eiseniibacteriota bacterium]
MGTPEFAVPALREVAQRTEVVAVVTQPDRPRGRGLALAPSAVARTAEELKLMVLKPEQPNHDTSIAALSQLRPDLFAVVAFGAILKPALLKLPRLGAINLHGSLLPDYRGASPVQRALWDGRATTGVTTMWMDEGLDTGDVIAKRETPILDDDDGGTLAARLAELGAPLLAESLMLAFEGRAPRTPQDRQQGSYARKLAKQDGEVNWSENARTVWNHQRAVTPWPGAGTAFRGERVKLERTRVASEADAAGAPGTVMALRGGAVNVACGAGTLDILEIQPAGRSRLSAADWARGARLQPGERFGSEGRVPA